MKLETKKIYAISQGSYSDYKIICLFSNRRKAREFIKEWDLGGGWRCDSLRIEEFILDPNTPEDIGERNTNVYEVEFDTTTDEIMEVYTRNSFSGDLSVVGVAIKEDYTVPYWIYRIWVEAKNREAAKKIASEIYMKAKAMNELPDVSKPIIREIDVLNWIKDGKVKITFQK